MAESPNDDELMHLVKEGREDAFTQLFRRHGSAVFGLCMRFFSGNRSRSEDVSQEVWMKVIRYARTYRPETRFKAWLMQVTRNACLREIEKNQVQYQMVSADDVDVAETFDLEEALIEGARDSEVRSAIDGLPTAQRAALLLWIDGTRSYDQIAAELKSTVSSVKSLLFRARQSLVERLKVS
jgi:RNA polymerase sigma-70 factor (ECF subfamily)